MRLVFLGVGEAFDEKLANNSHIVISETKLLLDCGYAIPRLLWSHFPDKDFLDAVYLTHAHADHYMGLPMIAARMAEEERTKPLRVLSHANVIKQMPSLFDHAYRGLLSELTFPIEFTTVSRDEKLRLGELTLSFAPSKHVIKNYGVRVECDGKSVCYSGDGAYTDATKELYRGTDLLIHEAYDLEASVDLHANIRDVMAMCEEVEIKHLALTHLNRGLRRNMEMVMRFIEGHAGSTRVTVPEPLEEFSFS